MRKVNYDRITPYYDFLSRLVFQDNQRKPQYAQLNFLKNDDRMLIVGGGSGWILEAIYELKLSGLEVIYLEHSESMLYKSKYRNTGNLNVKFIHLDVELFQEDKKFDVIMTPFLFDNFKQEKATKVFSILDDLLKEDGHWFHADFTHDTKGGWWKEIIINLMYRFLRMWSAVDHSEFVDMSPIFDSFGYELIWKQFYFSKFIYGKVYRKNSV